MIKDKRLKPCPFCGKVPTIYVCDEEGNIKNDDYVNDTYSGLFYSICHEMDDSKGNDNVCPIATFKGEILETQLYESIDELVERWNRRICSHD